MTSASSISSHTSMNSISATSVGKCCTVQVDGATSVSRQHVMGQHVCQSLNATVVGNEVVIRLSKHGLCQKYITGYITSSQQHNIIKQHSSNRQEIEKETGKNCHKQAMYN